MENWNTRPIFVNVYDPCSFWCARGLWRSAAIPLDSTARGSAEEGLGILENHLGELLLQKRSTDMG